jgi:hypothetical protein
VTHQRNPYVKRNVVTLTAALLFGGTITTGCAAYSGTTGTEQCRASVDNPHISKGLTAKKITGIVSKLRYGCSPLPSSHTITVYNEHKDGDGVWRSYSDDTYGQPDAAGATTTGYGTYLGCINGTWRAHFLASGVSTTGLPFGPVGEFSGEQSIKCP